MQAISLSGLGKLNLHIDTYVLPNFKFLLQYALHLCIWYFVTKACKSGDVLLSGMWQVNLS